MPITRQPLIPNKLFINGISIISIIILLSLSILMLNITLSYFPWQNTTGFLVLKQDVVELPWWNIAFKLHVSVSMLCILAGFTQFNRALPKKYHKWFGKLYAYTLLLFAAPSGAILAWYAAGGLPTQVCFMILTILWVIFTILGIRAIYAKKIKQHQAWMIRSYALTLSALSLRTWKVVLYYFAPAVSWLTPIHIYQLEAWLGWGINLIIAELIIFWLITKPYNTAKLVTNKI